MAHKEVTESSSVPIILRFLQSLLERKLSGMLELRRHRGATSA